jgi:hypothetical protein
MFFMYHCTHDTCFYNDITHIAFEFLVLMVACLSPWATSSTLSMLAYTFDEFLNVAIGNPPRSQYADGLSLELSPTSTKERGENAFKPTDDNPVARTRDTQHLDLNGPPTMHAQRRRLYPIECVQATCCTFSAEVEPSNLNVSVSTVPNGMSSARSNRALKDHAQDGMERYISRCEGARR